MRFSESQSHKLFLVKRSRFWAGRGDAKENRAGLALSLQVKGMPRLERSSVWEIYIDGCPFQPRSWDLDPR